MSPSWSTRRLKSSSQAPTSSAVFFNMIRLLSVIFRVKDICSITLWEGEPVKGGVEGVEMVNVGVGQGARGTLGEQLPQEEGCEVELRQLALIEELSCSQDRVAGRERQEKAGERPMMRPRK